jgi:SAM-dependent methyltransferase
MTSQQEQTRAQEQQEVFDPWQQAYLRFETPEEETRKFMRRLRKAGSRQWPKKCCIVEMFSGRGNGLHALSRLGFTNLTALDLSPALLGQYCGSASCCVGDARLVPFKSLTADIVVVHGGLHHLLALPQDLEAALREIHRILRRYGLLVVVEPWMTPFLRFVHFVCEMPLCRRISPKLDALATMNEHERETYDNWLNQPDLIVSIIKRYFSIDRLSFEWGKIHLVAQKTADLHSSE